MKLKKAYFAGAALAIAAAAAYAAPPYGYTNVYYSDASYTTQVGQSEFTCSGRWYRSGVETDYFIETNQNQCRYAEYDISP